MQIADTLRKAGISGCTDVFITAGKRDSSRQKGSVIHSGSELRTENELNSFRQSVISSGLEEHYRTTGSADASFTVDGIRFRINFFQTLSGPALVARPILSGNTLFFEKLGLPEQLREICDAPRGLILIAGSTGSGKSTTMAAMINYINMTKQRHILTLEDPIEFLHTDEKSLVSQREINTDAAGFSSALRSALRENPDVIVIGELRDAETMQTAVNAALTGHLVIGTVHTSNAVLTAERIVNMFPEDSREQAAVDIGTSLNAVVAQRLLPRADASGMIPAVEILVGTPSVKKLVGDMDFNGLEEVLRENSGFGMMLFNRAIFQLYREGKISLSTAREASDAKEEFDLLVKGMESGVDSFRNQYRSGMENNAPEDSVDMRRLLRTALVNHASDLHLSCGVSPTLRINGELRPMELPPLTRQDIQRLLFSVINQRQRVELEAKRELDFALSVALSRKSESSERDLVRFRINAFYQRGSLGVVGRVVNMRIPSPQELHLPPQLVRMAFKQQGLILITGPTGSGKSTTMASLLNQINLKSAKHIITIEDPIEYVHDNINSIVEQRELHADTLSFASALKYALRQDPDVIMVGEMRDTETMAATLTAAETGHLVFATIHTNNAPQTIDRIVDSFPTDQQNQIRLQLSGVLLGVLSQRLLPRLDGNGRAAAFELMAGTPPILALVRDGRTHQLQSVMETSQKDGMCTLEKSLEELYEQGLISEDQKQAYRADYQQTRDF